MSDHSVNGVGVGETSKVVSLVTDLRPSPTVEGRGERKSGQGVDGTGLETMDTLFQV